MGKPVAVGRGETPGVCNGRSRVWRPAVPGGVPAGLSYPFLSKACGLKSTGGLLQTGQRECYGGVNPV